MRHYNVFEYGTRNKNRTYTNRVKVCCAATTPFGNKLQQIFKEQVCIVSEPKILATTVLY